MLRPILLSLVLASQLSAVVAAQESKSITDAETVLAIYANDWGLVASGGPQLVVCVWGDGSVVWSNDHVNGGPPCFTAQLDPKDVAATMKKLVDIGAFAMPRLNQAKFGPDSKFTTLLVRTAGKELKMDSWHELYESNGKVIAAAQGLTGLDGKTLLSALADQPAEYLLYRMAWLEVRLAVANLVPKTGTKTTCVPVMLRGKLQWQSNEDRTKR